MLYTLQYFHTPVYWLSSWNSNYFYFEYGYRANTYVRWHL